MNRRGFLGKFLGACAAGMLPAKLVAGGAGVLHGRWHSTDHAGLGAERACRADLLNGAGLEDIQAGNAQTYVFLSDLHVCRGGITEEKLRARVAKILEIRPDKVIVLGDLAYRTGKVEDYECVREVLAPIIEAGIGLHLCLGNHDRREEFSEIFPEFMSASPVPGRLAGVVNGRFADIVLLDSLKQGADTSTWIADGELDGPQLEWLKSTIEKCSRPFFVAAHHPLADLGIGRLLADNPLCAGYIHGHNHKWQTDWIEQNWKAPRILRTLCLPTTGSWGDNGYTVLSFHSDGAQASLFQDDFYFPKPLSGSERPAVWNRLVEDHQGLNCSFVY